MNINVLLIIALNMIKSYKSMIIDGNTWENYYDHHLWLEPKEQFKLYWKILNKKEIEIGMIAKTNGWIGFGISNNNQMINSDIRIGWIDNSNKPVFQNRYTTSKRNDGPIYYSDLTNNKLISLKKNNSWIQLRFKKNINSCNKSHYNSKSIIKGTTRIIFASSNSIPITLFGKIPYHDINKGSHSINFFDGIIPKTKLPKNVEEYSVTMSNYSVPAKDTTYHCKFISLPREFKEAHLIRIDPVIQNGNEGIVHHIIIYQCDNTFNSGNIGYETDCNNFANMPYNGTNCRTVNIAGWAVGGGNFYFPKNVGQLIKGKLNLLLEIHYDNPYLQSNFIDSSGMKLYFTNILKKYSTNLISINTPYNGIFIPGGLKKSITMKVYYNEYCSKKIIPKNGLTVFAANLHSHTTGIANKIQHIRNGIELKPISDNKYYDFNYQQTINVNNTIVMPGDLFIAHCTYNTKNRFWPVYGGESTRDEMCIHSFNVYPMINVSFGGSTFTDIQYKNFFKIAIDNGWWNGTDNYTINVKNKNKFYYNTSDANAVQHYIDFINSKKRLMYCYSGTQFVYAGFETIPDLNITELKEENNCLEEKEKEKNIAFKLNECLFGVLFVIIFLVTFFI